MSDDGREATPTPGANPVHEPVLAARVVELLATSPGRLLVDATVGLGGHSELLLRAGARVIGLDRDANALAFARARLADFERDGRFVAFHTDYRRLLPTLAANDLGPIDGLVADLGVSSYQLDDPERGFSFRRDGPLDMRMDRSAGMTAADVVNEQPEDELVRILRVYGEEPAARKIARAIVAARAERPFQTTGELAELVASVHRPPRRRSPGTPPIHPATLTFQALRIVVNDELADLDKFVSDAVSALRAGGRIAIIAFHSLEDRPIKRALAALARGCDCPPRLVMCVCGRKPQVKLTPRRPYRPDDAECAINPRARSARMRVAEKIVPDLAPELRTAA